MNKTSRVVLWFLAVTSALCLWVLITAEGCTMPVFKVQIVGPMHYIDDTPGK